MGSAMQTRIGKRRPGWLVLCMSFAVTLALSACFNDGGDDESPTIIEPTTPPAAAVNTPISLQLISTSGILKDVPLTVSLSGSGLADVRNQSGAAISGPLTTTTGILPLQLAAGVTPTAAAPVEITIVVSGDGYLTTGKTISLSSTAPIDVPLYIVKMATAADGTIVDPPAGVSGLVREDISASGGKVTEVLKLDAPVADETGAVVGGSTLEVPTTVTLMGADGTPAADGPVKASVVSFSAAAPDSLASFPGGFAVDVDGSGAGTGSGVFVSGGFAAFNLTDSTGKPIKKFSAPITATMTLPAGIVNETTGEPVKVGEALPLYSYEESTGKWSKEIDGTVTAQNADGSFVFSFQTTHLSYWNMDWHYSSVCTSSIRVNGANATTYLSAQFEPANGYLYSGYATPDQPVFSVRNAPRGKRLKITATNSSGTVVGSTTVADMCSGQIVITVTSPPPTQIGFSTSEACYDAQGAIIASTKRALPSWVTVYEPTWVPYYYTYYFWGRAYYYYSWYYAYNYAGSAYTTGSGATATANLVVKPAASSYTAYVYSPRGQSRLISPINTVAAQTTTAPEVIFPMTCRTVTGTGGGS
jgi:hypothetical protein